MREDWIECKVGDVFNFVGGGTPSTTNETYWNGDTPWASIKDIKGDFLNSTINKITNEGLTNSASNLVAIDEVILATRINPGRPIISKINTSINQDLKVVKPKVELPTLFVFYLFKFLEKQIIGLSSGTTVLGIGLNPLKDIKFSLPPLPEQRAIVKKLESLFSSLDAGVADLKKAQQQLKIYRQAVLKKAFEGEWSQLKLEDVAKWGSGGTPSRRNSSFFIGSIPWVKTGELNSKFINDSEEKISEEAIKKSSAKLFPSGSVAIAMYGATIGKASIFGSEMSTNQACAVGQCYDNIFNEFLYYFLVSQKQQFIKLGIGGAQPNISQGTIKNYPIKLPSIAEQHQIVKQIESRLSVCDSIEQNIKESLEKAEALRQSILKKAFEGNLLTAQELAECKLADDYEPASVLLEKIKAEETEIKAKPSKKKPRHSVAKS